MRIGVDETIVYASPSCAQILGRTPEELQGTPALANVHEDDLSRAKEMLAALRRGEITEGRMIYRKRHHTKGEIWLETALRATQASEQRCDRRRRCNLPRCYRTKEHRTKA